VLPDFFESLIWELTNDLADAPDVNVGEWQAMRDPELPQLQTIEVEDVSFEYYIPEDVGDLQKSVRPNLPWAEEHFTERVSGIPYNPPPSHVRWPFAQRGNTDHTDEQQQFSHTYPERIWPPRSLTGIRYNFGNLNDLVDLLSERPSTRQAYLPIWYPEDIYAASQLSVRVPCTLGYHFLIRGDKMKVTYYIRSCDFYRHFRDDVYMAARLCQWVSEAVGVKPSRLVMHISSLHIFSAERSRVRAEVDTAVLLGKTQ
jgi:thymidylate synthase